MRESSSCLFLTLDHTIPAVVFKGTVISELKEGVVVDSEEIFLNGNGTLLKDTCEYPSHM